jgi:hypothetical protein
MKSATTPPYSSASSAASAAASASSAASAFSSFSASSSSSSKVRLQWGGASFGFLGRAKCLNK